MKHVHELLRGLSSKLPNTRAVLEISRQHGGLIVVITNDKTSRWYSFVIDDEDMGKPTDRLVEELSVLYLVAVQEEREI